MKLSICVTRYKEDWETCKLLFDSIATQRGIDFNDVEVIVSSDGAGMLDVDFSGYPFEVRQIEQEHKGISANRNNAMANSNGDYLMFCDCDDMFLDNLGLHLVFAAMNEKPQLIVSHFIEEAKDYEGKYRIVRHEPDATFIHGKVYKKSFLEKNDIKFDESLTIHEDGYFNLIAQIVATDKKEIKTPFYLWKWNDTSTVRTYGEDCTLLTYDHLMKCRVAICNELKKRGYMDKYQDAVAKTVIDSYYDFNKPNYLKPENKEAREKAERAFKMFYMQFRDDYKDTPIKRISELMYVCRTHAFTQGLRVEQITIKDWLAHIILEVK